MPNDYPYAGLILPDVRDLPATPYLESAGRVLARLDPRPDAEAPTRLDGQSVMGRCLGIMVTPEEHSDYGPRVLLEVVTVDGSSPDESDAARLLSEAVREALEHSSADILEWYSPDVLIDRDDFIRLRNFVSPRQLGRVDAEIEDNLFESAAAAQAICGTLYPKAPEQRPASPGLPAVVPVAAKTGILARFRGFNLRRSSRAAAVTCLYVALMSTGQMNQVVTTLLP